LFVPHFNFLEQLKTDLTTHPDFVALRPLNTDLTTHPEFVALRQEILANPTKRPEYTIANDLILLNNRIWLPKGIAFIQTLLQEFHSTPNGGHMGIKKTLACLG